MFDYIIMYLLVVAENTKEFFNGLWSSFLGGTGAVLMIALVLLQVLRVLGGDDWSEKNEEMYTKISPWCIRVTIILIGLSMGMQFIHAMTPNMKQAAIIYIVPKVINNPNVQQLPDNVLVFFNECLKELTAVVKGEAAGLASTVSQAAKEKAVEAIGSINKTEEKK